MTQPSVLMELPSSHSSPASTRPSPQLPATQVLGQPSPSIVFPSSQVSTPAQTWPSPQRAAMHMTHESSLEEFPSSHSSTPART